MSLCCEGGGRWVLLYDFHYWPQLMFNLISGLVFLLKLRIMLVVDAVNNHFKKHKALGSSSYTVMADVTSDSEVLFLAGKLLRIRGIVGTRVCIRIDTI